MLTMEPLGDCVVRATHEVYAALPTHGKPQVRSNGVPEWTILASMSLVIPAHLVSSRGPRAGSATSSASSVNIPLPDVTGSPPTTSASIDSSGSLDTAAAGRPRSSRSRSRRRSGRSSSSSSSQTPATPAFPSSSLPSIPDSDIASLLSSTLERIGLDDEPGESSIRVISIASGVKCLSADRLPPLGDAIRDSHAEVLAKRGFTQWLLYEARAVLKGQKKYNVLDWDGTRFSFKEGVKVVLYVSALPCGDASTLHTAAHQPAEMAALKTMADNQTPFVTPGSAVRGRNGYENYGAIRTKPGRADSNPTISFSCSDKIAVWNVLGIQGALLANLFEPVYLDMIVIGGVEKEAPPSVQLDGGSWHDRIRGEAQRALYDRAASVEGRLPPPYRLHRPEIHLSAIPFAYSKSAIASATAREPLPTVVSLVQILPTGHVGEVIYNGTRQGGNWRPPGLEVIAERQRTKLCKLEILRSYLETVALACPDQIIDDATTLHHLKHPHASSYQAAKAVLRGQPSQPVPEAFASHVPVDCKATCATGNDCGRNPPFRGWIVAGRAFEAFNKDGRLVDDNGNLLDVVKAEAKAKPKKKTAQPVDDEAAASAAVDHDRLRERRQLQRFARDDSSVLEGNDFACSLLLDPASLLMAIEAN